MKTILTAAAACAISCSSALAQDYTLKFGIPAADDPVQYYVEAFEEELEALSEGRIDVVLYPRSQLGAIPSQIEGVQLGTIEAVATAAGFFVGADERFSVFSTPTLFSSNDNAADTLLEPGLNARLRELGRDQGLISIGWVVYGPTHYAALEPILTISDFEGLKLRVNASAMEREKMRRLGATGIPLPLGEVLPALQRGELDGTQSATAVFNAFRFDDVVTSLTVTNDTMIIIPAMVSQVWFEGLPDDLQAHVIEAGLRAQAATDPWQRASLLETDALWEERGGTFVRLDPEEQEAFDDLLRTIGDEVTADAPEVRELLEDIRAVSAQF